MDDVQRPELVFGLVGPIGCDITEVESALIKALKHVDYSCRSIRLSDSISVLLENKTGCAPDLDTLEKKISAGNQVRKSYSKNGILAAHAVLKIREARTAEHLDRGSEDSEEIELADKIADGTAYIIRQLKRPEEIELLTKTYGRHFVQISITQGAGARHRNLLLRAGRDQPGLSPQEKDELARKLIAQDQNELDEPHGQRLEDIFHRGDVFIDCRTEQSITHTTNRFVEALFGRTNIAPTRDEFGSYMAKAASLRSVDLSRQVGSAILTKDGDIISVGCNEVPKPLGGDYWDEDDEKHRDIDTKGEANKEETQRIIYSIVEALRKAEAFKSDKQTDEILREPAVREAVAGSLVNDITEYGRMVHAEMNALADSARLGRSVRNATMYVTTFPCHNCAKHLIASGIDRVVYIEPYPKSRAGNLYGEAISEDESKDCESRVSFQHFSGISPRRYRDIFEKGRRKSKETGEVLEWYEDLCIPRLGGYLYSYPENELHAIIDNLPEDVT